MRWRFLYGAMALFVIVMLVNATILFSTLSGSFAEAVAEQYRSITETLTLAQTNSVFVRDDKLKQRLIDLVAERVEYIANQRQRHLALSAQGGVEHSVVAFTTDEGQVIGSQPTDWFGEYLFPLNVLNSIRQQQEIGGENVGSVVVRQNGFQYIVAPFTSTRRDGYAVIRLPVDSVNPSFWKFLHQVQHPLMLIFVFGFLSLFAVAFFSKIDFANTKRTRKKLVVGVSLVAVVGQIIIVLMIGKEFSQHYLDVSRANANWVSSVAAVRLGESTASVEQDSNMLKRLLVQTEDVESFTVYRRAGTKYAVQNPNLDDVETRESVGARIAQWLTGYEEDSSYF